jgi:hypothetical protein
MIPSTEFAGQHRASVSSPTDLKHASILPYLLAGFCLVPLACDWTAEPPRPPECADAWRSEAARALVDQLARATAADRAVWLDVDVGDASYVLNAGPSDSGGVCLGLWGDGRAISYARTDEEPTLLTPLYGYWFHSDWYGRPDAAMLERAAQPPSVRTWLESTGVRSAVILPVTVPDFPMELPALVKVQLGMHEAFHVDVQAPRWYASTGNWPAWDRQPDRPGLQVCYTASPDVEAALEAEREFLVAAVESLMDGDTALACEAGRAFLARRNDRYRMLADVQVARHDGTPGTCGEAESIMELEEGTADWASWTVLYDIGEASRESVVRRYRARQDEVFYLTGAMQLHAVQLMQPDSMLAIARRIAESDGPDDGALTNVLARALATFCR